MRSELGSPQVSTLLEAERTLQAPQEGARLPLPSQAAKAQCGALCGAHAARPMPCSLLHGLEPVLPVGTEGRRPGTALARGLTVRTPGTAICLHLENAIPAACCGQLGSQNRETAFILLQNYKRAINSQGKHCSAHKTCFPVEMTKSPKFANPGRNYRLNLYPYSIPQCHESCLLGPAEKSRAFTQLHSSTSTAAGNQAEGEQR